MTCLARGTSTFQRIAVNSVTWGNYLGLVVSELRIRIPRSAGVAAVAHDTWRFMGARMHGHNRFRLILKGSLRSLV